MPDIALRLVQDSDHDALFAFHTAPGMMKKVGISSYDASDRDAFDALLNRLRVDKSVVLRAITRDGEVVGSIVAQDTGRIPQIGFVIDPAHWGEGIATAALIAFTAMMKRRPLQAVVASDNAAAIRVLEKAGFARINTRESLAPEHDAPAAEHVHELGFFPAPTFTGTVIT